MAKDYRPRVPTQCSVVLEVLRKTDDFVNYAMLMQATGYSVMQVSAACHNLRKHNAIGVEVAPDGTGWWYALPPEYDNRTYVLKGVVDGIERPNRKPRKLKHSTHLKRGHV